MSYSFDQPMRAWRDVDVPAVAGFATSSVGFAALVVELAVRGWWGFATSGWELLVVLGWLGASRWLSWWAFTWAEGGWKVLAFFGVVLSVVAVVTIVAVFALRVLAENPYLLDGNSKRSKSHRSRSRRGRGRRRRY